MYLHVWNNDCDVRTRRELRSKCMWVHVQQRHAKGNLAVRYLGYYASKTSFNREYLRPFETIPVQGSIFDVKRR